LYFSFLDDFIQKFFDKNCIMQAIKIAVNRITFKQGNIFFQENNQCGC